jgi:hypothetical protein
MYPSQACLQTDTHCLSQNFFCSVTNNNNNNNNNDDDNDNDDDDDNNNNNEPWENKDLNYAPITTSNSRDERDEYSMLQIMHDIGRHYNSLLPNYHDGIKRVEGDHLNFFICIYHLQNYLTIFS